MLEHLRRLFKHSAIYGIGSLFQSLVGFILIPVYTRYLAPNEYGLLEILNTILIILTMILSFGFASAILKVYEYDCRKDEQKKEALGTMYLFVIPLASIITLLISFFAKFLSLPLLGSLQYQTYLYLVLVTNLLAVFLNLSFAVLRVQEKSGVFSLFSFLKFILVFAFNLTFVVIFRLGVLGILLGNLISQIIISLLFLPTIFTKIKFTFNKLLFKKLWRFGIAIIPASLAMWIMDLSDRYFLKHFSTMSEVGLYSLGYKIGMLVSLLLVTPFQLAWPTISFSAAKKNNTKEIYAKVLTYFTFISSLFALFLSLFAKPAIKIFTSPSYYSAYIIVPLVAFSYVLYGIHYILVPGLHLQDKSKYYPFVVGLPAAINLILNYIFVPKYGMMGAAATTFASFATMAFFAYTFTQKFYQIKYEWLRLLKIALTAAIILGLNYLFKNETIWKLILYNFSLLFSFPVILYFLRFYEQKEIMKIKEFFTKVKNLNLKNIN